jgi:probable HAF family extracellular repeat protein
MSSVRRAVAVSVSSALLLVALSGMATAQQPTFQALGFLGAPVSSSQASAIDGSGSRLVGRSNSAASAFGNSEAFYADVTPAGAGGPLVGLGGLATATLDSEANAISADGTVIVGRARYGATSARQAFRRTLSGANVALAFPSNAVNSNALGADASGSVVVGWASNSAGVATAYRWVMPLNTPESLGTLAGDASSRARAVSADGTVIAGISTTSTGDVRAVQWRSGVLSALPALDASFPAREANAVSRDGGVIVGYSALGSSTSTRAVAWKSLGTVVEALPDIANGAGAAQAFCVNEDGTFIGGSARVVGGDFFGRAFVHRQGLGTIDLQSYLEAKGVPGLAGWTLYAVFGLSNSGLRVVGYGLDPSGNNQAFLVTLPASFGACNPADIADNGSNAGPDGAVDNGDFSLFISSFFNPQCG